jgi:hypothetical protein
VYGSGSRAIKAWLGLALQGNVENMTAKEGGTPLWVKPALFSAILLLGLVLVARHVNLSAGAGSVPAPFSCRRQHSDLLLIPRHAGVRRRFLLHASASDSRLLPSSDTVQQTRYCSCYVSATSAEVGSCRPMPRRCLLATRTITSGPSRCLGCPQTLECCWAESSCWQGPSWSAPSALATRGACDGRSRALLQVRRRRRQRHALGGKAVASCPAAAEHRRGPVPRRT